jgi:hypothetical protein
MNLTLSRVGSSALLTILSSHATASWLPERVVAVSRFWASFLAFVAELEVESIVSVASHSEKRALLIRRITPYKWVHLDEEDRWWFSTSAIVNLGGPFPERMMDWAAIALAGTGSDSEIVIEELGRGLLVAIT